VRSTAFLSLLLALGSGLPAAESHAKPKEFTPLQKRWWSFQPVVKAVVPTVGGKDWVKNDIDAFILAKLEEKKIAPNAPADKVTLIRRATLDMTGLPPTVQEVQDFLADTSPRAFEKVVDRLLASPRYGERYARHWLDLARYADSDGFKADDTRPHVWRYRDYVIQSLNSDKPFHRFVEEQIAGDELFPSDPAALVATGFNRHFPDEYNAANIAQRRQELLNDVTDTVGYAFLGLTVACARCHDHKFDPILQKDYYRLQAFFANTRLKDDAELLLDAPARERYFAKRARWEEATADVRAQMQAILKPARDKFHEERMSRFPAEIQEALQMDPAARSPYQSHMALKAAPQVYFKDEEVETKLKGEAKARYQALKAELAKFNHLYVEMPVAQTMVDDGVRSPATHVLSQGAYDAPLEEVQPGFLTILDPADAKFEALPNSTGRRTALAKWLTDPKNPLTARVIVNRVWGWHFGKALAGSPSDFGTMGERPANKELLDYLAATFVEDGWSLKKLHRRILLSSVYQQSSAFNEASAKADPQNKLLWRYNRRRLEAEAVRDSMLATAGVLNAKMYGPGVFPPLPAGMATRGGWAKHEDAADAARRSIYIFVRRNTRYPMLEAFDLPDTHESCARRNATMTPMQALELMNNNLVTGWAQAFARRVRNDEGVTESAQIDRAWRLAFSRPASPEEQTMAKEFLARQAALGADSPLADLTHMLFNSNEFLYID